MTNRSHLYLFLVLLIALICAAVLAFLLPPTFVPQVSSQFADFSVWLSDSANSIFSIVVIDQSNRSVEIFAPEIMIPLPMEGVVLAGQESL